MKKLTEFIEDTNYYTKTLSDINRQLAFAGIAIIWLFRVTSEENVKIEQDLILPLILMVVALTFDLFQYLFYSIFCSISILIQKRKNKQNNDAKEINIPVNTYVPIIGLILFYIKVAACIIGFVLIFIYLVRMLF